MNKRNTGNLRVAGALTALAVILVIIVIIIIVNWEGEKEGPKPGAGRKVSAEEKARKVRVEGRDRRHFEGPMDVETTEKPTGDAEEETPREEGYFVSGRVIDEEGLSIADAEVSVHLDYPETVGKGPRIKGDTTDEEGNFKIADLPAKGLLLTAEKEGYYFAVPGVERSGRPVRFRHVYYNEGSDGVEDLELVMLKGETISGTVVDEEDNPIGGADLKLWQWAGFSVELTSDDDGRFRNTTLAPGSYRLNAAAEGFAKYYLDAVRTGTEDLVVRLERGGLVKGFVIFSESGEPASGAQVAAWKDYYRRTETTADEMGGFEMTISPGVDTNLSATYENYIIDEVKQVTCERGESVEGLVLSLVKAGSISGVVLEEGTEKPVADVQLRLYSASRQWIKAVSDEEGKFHLKGLDTGTKWVQIVSDQYNSSDGRQLSFQVKKGEETSGVKVYVSRKSSVIGRVVTRDDAPVAGATVRMASQQIYIYPQGTAVTTDKDGKFSLKKISRRYMRGMSLFVTHPDYAHKLVRLEEGGEPGSTEEITVVLDEGGSIEGSITDSEGSPLQGVKVALTMSQSARYRASTFEIKKAHTDKEGNYKLPGVAQGKYKVKASIGRRSVESDEVEMAEYEALTGVDLILGSSGHISGTVTDEDARPVAGISLSAGDGRNYSSTTTGTDGTYKFENLEEGREYKISVQPWGGGRGRRYERIEPKSIEATTEGVDFVIIPLKTGTVTGYVYRRSDNTPVTKFFLTLLSGEQRRYRYNSRYTRKKFESEDGFFKCTDVTPGPYTIQLAAPGLPDHQTGPFEVLPEIETDMTIYIDEGETVRGRVIDKNGTGIGGATVKAAGRARQYIERSDPDLVKKSVTDDLGGFEIRNLKPGRISLEASHPDYAKGSANNIEVKEGEVTGGIEITLEKGSLIYGRVRDAEGKAKNGQNVSIYNRSPRFYKTERTDGEGKYSFPHVPDGTYSVSVPQMSATKYVTLKEEEEIEINFDFSLAGSVSGRLYITSDRPEEASFFIYARDAAANGGTYTGRKSSKVDQDDDTFKLEGLLPGKYKLTLVCYGKKDGRSVNMDVKTSPSEIIVKVEPEEEIRMDITVIEITERAARERRTYRIESSGTSKQTLIIESNFIIEWNQY